MKIVTRLTKEFIIFLVILLLFFFFKTDLVYARGGCFASGTNILTLEGSKYIEQLQSTDHIVGFNLDTHQAEEERIGEIQVIQSPDYYLINGNTKVTGTHPFYVRKGEKIELIKVQSLNLGDQLIGVNEAQLFVSSIDHIKKPIAVYNLLSVTPHHNFYANNVLVHNKGGGGHGGGGGGHGGSGAASTNTQIKPITALIFTIYILMFLPLSFRREIYNFIRFRSETFTNDSDLIDFTKAINSKFTNSYSIRYSEDEENWTTVTAAEELDENNYQNLVSKSELIERIHQLFVRYQNDWCKKDFDKMTEYIAQPFYDEQYNIFKSSFGENFDIVYEPKLNEVIPLGYQLKGDQGAFQVQINAQMVNFELSPQGFVMSGKDHARSFTEYWAIGVDSTKQFYLLGINQATTVVDTTT